MERLAIGIDIGGTRTKIGLVNLGLGEVIETLVYETETKNEARFFKKIGEAINALKACASKSNSSIAGIGFGVPGFVFENGVVDSTYGFIEFMEDYPLVNLIEEKFQLKCRADNDARVVALGEALYGEGRGFGRVLVLTLGTGLGLGFTVNQALDGLLPFAHMGGHIKVTDLDFPCYCRKTGCLESLVSAGGLVNLMKNALAGTGLENEKLTAEMVFESARENHTEAVNVLQQYLGYLRTGIDNYINIYAPDMVVLGGGVAKSLPAYLPGLHQHGLLSAYKNYRPVLTVSKLQEQAGILGSAALFKHKQAD